MPFLPYTGFCHSTMPIECVFNQSFDRLRMLSKVEALATRFSPAVPLARRGRSLIARISFVESLLCEIRDTIHDIRLVYVSVLNIVLKSNKNIPILPIFTTLPRK
jgi:hypothetical protein